MPTNRLRNILVGIVAAAVVSLFLLSSSSTLRKNLAKRDSIAYWAAGKLLTHHDDPYSPIDVLNLERSQAYSETKPLVLRTPPWSLFIVLPLGLTNAFAAWVLWVAVSLTALVCSVRLCWKMYGDEPSPPAIFLLVAYLFAPVPACLVAGQMGLVLLLGLILFLWSESNGPFFAGASLILPFAKPHLLSLFWIVLAIWAIERKDRAFVAGFVTSLTGATCIALIFDPAIFSHYIAMLNQAAIGHEFIPALSGVIRLLFFHRLFWVQFVPLALGLVWSVWFYWKNRPNWNWRVHGPALMVVSVLTTPYAWLTDEVVLLPAVLQATIWAYSERDRLSAMAKIAVTILAALNVLLLLILKAKVPFSTGIYFWSSLVWFGWYFYARKFQPAPKELTTAALSRLKTTIHSLR
jgi:Glycosyltransferase family 87